MSSEHLAGRNWDGLEAARGLIRSHPGLASLVRSYPLAKNLLLAIAEEGVTGREEVLVRLVEALARGHKQMHDMMAVPRIYYAPPDDKQQEEIKKAVEAMSRRVNHQPLFVPMAEMQKALAGSQTVPVTRNNKPIGTAKNIRVENGMVLADVELDKPLSPEPPSISITLEQDEPAQPAEPAGESWTPGRKWL